MAPPFAVSVRAVQGLRKTLGTPGPREGRSDPAPTARCSTNGLNEKTIDRSRYQSRWTTRQPHQRFRPNIIDATRLGSDNWPAKPRRRQSRSACGKSRSNTSDSPHGSITARRPTLEAEPIISVRVGRPLRCGARENETCHHTSLPLDRRSASHPIGTKGLPSGGVSRSSVCCPKPPAFSNTG